VIGTVSPSTLATERTYVRAFFDRFLRGTPSPQLLRPAGGPWVHLTMG
jgi:hypothetical protein